MKKISGMILAGMLSLLLAGCGEDEALTVFHDQMDGFYGSLSASVNILENIDPSSDTAVDEMLSELDNMSALFTDLDRIEVPPKYQEQFENIEEFAEEASGYMTEAASLYREAYAEGGYDDVIGEAARENYRRAMKRVNYIAILLQGRLPEDENIVIITEEETVDWDGGEEIQPQDSAPAEE